MPISFDLEELRDQNGCSIYLETGLDDPTRDISCKKALSSSFRKVYTVEIRDDLVNTARSLFRNDIDNGRLNIIHGDSANLESYIVGNPDFSDKVVFYLDAHIDNSNITQNYIARCPLMFELDAISKLPRNDNVIAIDDVRILRESHPWGETRYGHASYIDMIQQRIKRINPDYQFKYMDGYVPGDVLVAYI